MNVLIKRWVDALRSGNYDQTREILRDDNGYCCLGVLCDLAGAEWKRIDGDDYAAAAGYHGDWSETELPWSLRKQTGITTEFMDELAARNDGRRFLWPDSTVVTFEPHDFEQIADVIERELL